METGPIPIFMSLDVILFYGATAPSGPWPPQW